MLIDFFIKLRDYKVPVSLNEFLIFLEALGKDFIEFDINKFYYLARTSLVKDEKLFDRFDIVFSEYFKYSYKYKSVYLLIIVGFVAGFYLISCYLSGVLKKENFKTN